MMEVCAVVAVLCTGIWLGNRTQARKWAEAADRYDLMEFEGAYYHVVRHGNFGKADDVRAWIRDCPEVLVAPQPREGWIMELIFTRTVCVTARKKGESGPPTAGWRYRLQGTKDDQDAINMALETAQRVYGEEYEGFAFAKADGNIMEVVDPEVRGGLRWETAFPWEPGKLY